MVFKKIIFQNRYVELETPPLHEKTILNFHFNYFNTRPNYKIISSPQFHNVFVAKYALMKDVCILVIFYAEFFFWGGVKKRHFWGQSCELANVLKWSRLIPNDQSNLSLAIWDHSGPICIVWVLFGPKLNFASRTKTAVQSALELKIKMK